jgi:methionine biosynthesis protein MetW
MAKQQNKIKIKYSYPEFSPQQLDPQNIDRLAIERVPKNATVLDIGCATGFMGKYLREQKNCHVFGIEIRPQEREVAKKNLDGVLLVDVESPDFSIQLQKSKFPPKFDVILATSVIEHLKYPAQFLQTCQKLIKPQGILIVTTPNIAHWSMRLSLLKGNFTYTEYGILDNTHLHLFTIPTFKKIFQENNYEIKEVTIDPVGGGHPRISRIAAKLFPNLFAYQMLIVAQKKHE